MSVLKEGYTDHIFVKEIAKHGSSITILVDVPRLLWVYSVIKILEVGSPTCKATIHNTTRRSSSRYCIIPSIFSVIKEIIVD